MENQSLLINTENNDIEDKQATHNDLDKKDTIYKLLKLFFLVFLYFSGNNPTMSTTDQYIKEVISASYNQTDLSKEHENCLQGNNTDFLTTELKIQSETSYTVILINCAGLIPQFFITFLLGPCSDQIGRKIAFVLPPVGGCLKAVIFMIVSSYRLSYYVLCIGSFIDGILGSFPLFFTACIAYIADVTEIKDRSLWLCTLDVVVGLSMVISNVASGFVITKLGFAWMYLVMAITFCLCSLVAAILVPETVKEQKKVTIFTLYHFKRTFQVYSIDNATNRRWKLLMLLVVISLINIGNQDVSDVSNLVLINTPICFTPELLGFFAACLYVSKTIGCLLLMKMNNCGFSIGGLLLISISSFIGYQLILTWAYHVETLFVSTLAGFGQLLAMPLSRSLISPLGSATEQGALFAAATWLQNLSGLIGNVSQDALYAATVSVWRGLVFLVTASINGCALVTMIILLVLWKREDKRKSNKMEITHGANYGSINDNNQGEGDTPSQVHV